jgi:DNA-binding transcriptional LysR family regulator
MVAGRVVRVLPDYQINKVAVRLVYPSRRLLSAKVRSFVDFMMAQFPHPDCDPWLAS